MNHNEQSLIATDITSEMQLEKMLDNCGISSQSPKDVDWLIQWWEREFELKKPPVARHMEVVGDDNVALDLCIAIEDQFVFYAFDDRDY